MITSIHIQNYRSIVDATINLAPFTLLIGANGTGKSNFLQLLEELGAQSPSFERHYNYPKEPQVFTIQYDDGTKESLEVLIGGGTRGTHSKDKNKVRIYRINPENIAKQKFSVPILPLKVMVAVRSRC